MPPYSARHVPGGCWQWPYSDRPARRLLAVAAKRPPLAAPSGWFPPEPGPDRRPHPVEPIRWFDGCRFRRAEAWLLLGQVGRALIPAAPEHLPRCSWLSLASQHWSLLSPKLA